MSTQLNDAIAQAKAALSKEIKAVADRLGQPDPDIAAAVSSLNEMTAQLDAETAALTTPTPTV